MSLCKKLTADSLRVEIYETRRAMGDAAGAAALQMKYKPLIDALFSEVNPIPIKAALHALGLCSDYARLPLTPMSAAARENLLNRMREVEIDV